MTTEDIDIDRISGNAPDDVKAVVADTSVFFVLARNIEGVNGPIFGEAITKRLVVTEVSVDKKIEEPSRMEGRVVCELTVEDGEETPSLCVNDVAYGWGESTDMVNGGGKIHGGCSAFLIDVSGTLPIVV
ncbi:hypothetical protein DXG03_007641 [Asterophora parasitica]|uniref:Uncharacterized protein n=1 Tax=Asterophora parasitica TaxID=117018 RepID=A0A9P7KD38_9AGAR|nr:hypothetical protein DXG03_007641 [Asterophora parasitica]